MVANPVSTWNILLHKGFSEKAADLFVVSLGNVGIFDCYSVCWYWKCGTWFAMLLLWINMGTGTHIALQSTPWIFWSYQVQGQCYCLGSFHWRLLFPSLWPLLMQQLQPTPQPKVPEILCQCSYLSHSSSSSSAGGFSAAASYSHWEYFMPAQDVNSSTLQLFWSLNLDFQNFYHISLLHASSEGNLPQAGHARAAVDKLLAKGVERCWLRCWKMVGGRCSSWRAAAAEDASQNDRQGDQQNEDYNAFCTSVTKKHQNKIKFCTTATHLQLSSLLFSKQFES